MMTAPEDYIGKTIKMKGQPVVTIADCAPTNLTPFAMCTSLANPAVASATAAALGVLTPQPCTLSITGQWIPKTPTVKMGGKPVLTQDCTLMCAYGGQISIKSPGQVTISAG